MDYYLNKIFCHKSHHGSQENEKHPLITELIVHWHFMVYGCLYKHSVGGKVKDDSNFVSYILCYKNMYFRNSLSRMLDNSIYENTCWLQMWLSFIVWFHVDNEALTEDHSYTKILYLQFSILWVEGIFGQSIKFYVDCWEFVWN